MKIHSSNTRKLALFNILVALCLAMQLTPRPPNVEFTSFFTFTVGVIFGVLYGSFFGCTIMFVNGFLSPYGFAGLIMPFQMVGMAIPGILGGVYRRLMPEQINSARFCTETAIVGAIIALIYDLVTNVGVVFYYVLSGTNIALAILTTIVCGVFFSIVHIFSNTAVFGILTLPSIKTLNNLVGGEKNG
jgi:predicted membrane protein